MADESMDPILEQARHLGRLIQEHPYYQRLREADAAVRDDAEATKALEAYNQAATAIQEKEQKGRPVEPEEKRNLDTLRNDVVASEPIKAFSAAQANYADLMRRMNEAIFQSIARADQASAGGGDGSGAAEADTGGEGPSIITP
jgi:cell fate (sporulation/competence/biofilm development) regulator YlbF (YheA/YmcA/DUF963 family)